MKLKEKFIDPKDLTIQTFDDSEERRKNGQSKPELAQIFPHNLEKQKGLQGKGAGIYFPVNPQEDHKKRSIENTKEFVGIGLDIDVSKQSYEDSFTEIATKKSIKLQQRKRRNYYRYQTPERCL